jgi:methyl-accepting chemotaxis protein
LIDSLQYHLLLVNLTYFFAVVLVFAAAVFGPAMLDMNRGSWVEKQEAANQFLFLHARIWPAVLVLFALLVIHSVIMSHRIAGPLYRFRRIFSSVAGGDLTVRAVIRRRDYLRKEADSINQMITRLCSKVRSVEVESAELAALVGEIDKTVTNDSGRTRALLERLDGQLAELGKAVSGFRTPSKDVQPHEEQGSAEQEEARDQQPQAIANSS